MTALRRCGNPHDARPGSADGVAGFTLLEVLLALALLAVIGTTLYGTYFTVFRGRETTVAGMDERRALRGTLDLLRRELSATWHRRDNIRLAFVVEDRDHFGKPASRLAFSTLAPPSAGDHPISDQLAVEYGVIVKDERLTLARSAQDLFLTDKPLRYPQMDEIEGFLVECSPDGTKWVRSWDTAINGGLPRAVRVTLQLREGGRTVSYSTLAIIRMSAS